MTEKLGKITLRGADNKEPVLVFPLETLVNWYPFDVNYEYRFSNKRNKLYIALVDESVQTPSYGISTNKDRVKSEHASFELPEWYNAVIAEENMKTVELAKKLGIKTPEEDFTKEDVQNGFELLGRSINILTNIVTERFLSCSSEEAIKDYHRAKTEDKSLMSLAFCNDDDDKLFLDLGKVHSMLNIMRKEVA